MGGVDKFLEKKVAGLCACRSGLPRAFGARNDDEGFVIGFARDLAFHPFLPGLDPGIHAVWRLSHGPSGQARGRRKPDLIRASMRCGVYRMDPRVKPEGEGRERCHLLSYLRSSYSGLTRVPMRWCNDHRSACGAGRLGLTRPSSNLDGGSWALGSSPRVTIWGDEGFSVCHTHSVIPVKTGIQCAASAV